MNPKVLKTKIQYCRIERHCEHCTGLMKFTGSQGGNLYQHRCDKCGEIEYFRKQYPRIEYQDASEFYQIVEI